MAALINKHVPPDRHLSPPAICFDTLTAHLGGGARQALEDLAEPDDPRSGAL